VETRIRHEGNPNREYAAWREAVRRDSTTSDFETFLSQVGSAPASDPRAGLRRQPDGSYQWRRGKKLTAADVKEIRAMRDAGFLHKEIAPQFGISKSLVQKIVTFEAWKD
jgi:hypothetical protein